MKTSLSSLDLVPSRVQALLLLACSENDAQETYVVLQISLQLSFTENLDISNESVLNNLLYYVEDPGVPSQIFIKIKKPNHCMMRSTL